MPERDFTEIWDFILKLALCERYVFVCIGLTVGISKSGVHGSLPLSTLESKVKSSLFMPGEALSFPGG